MSYIILGLKKYHVSLLDLFFIICCTKTLFFNLKSCENFSQWSMPLLDVCKWLLVAVLSRPMRAGAKPWAPWGCRGYTLHQAQSTYTQFRCTEIAVEGFVNTGTWESVWRCQWALGVTGRRNLGGQEHSFCMMGEEWTGEWPQETLDFLASQFPQIKEEVYLDHAGATLYSKTQVALLTMVSNYCF